MRDSVLVVRHGPNRGRISAYCQSVFDDLSTHYPAVGAALRIHETGDREPSLASVRAVVFLLADPLEELYPECHADAMRIYERAVAMGLPTINPPPLLAKYRKRAQVETWRSLGLPTPEGRAYDSFDDLAAILEQVEFPVLIRADADHCMEGIEVVRTAREAARLGPDRVPLPGIVTRLIDVRRGYPRTGPDRIWAKLYHKKRVYVLGRHVIPDALYFSRGPTVAREVSMFQRLSEERLFAKRYIRTRTLRRAWMQFAESRCWAPHIFTLEMDFWRHAVDHAHIFRRAAESLGLGWVAIDYAVLSDGMPVLWEANPYPNIPSLFKGPQGKARRLSERGTMQLEAVSHFFDDLLTGSQEEKVRPKGFAAAR